MTVLIPPTLWYWDLQCHCTATWIFGSNIFQVILFVPTSLNWRLHFSLLLAFSHRGVHPLIWRQHVHEGGDANNYAHWSRGCLNAFSLPEGLRSPHGHHFPRFSRHTQDRVGWGSCQTHGQSRYRMLPPTPHLHSSVPTLPSSPMKWFTNLFSPYFSILLFFSYSLKDFYLL